MNETRKKHSQDGQRKGKPPYTWLPSCSNPELIQDHTQARPIALSLSRAAPQNLMGFSAFFPLESKRSLIRCSNSYKVVFTLWPGNSTSEVYLKEKNVILINILQLDSGCTTL